MVRLTQQMHCFTAIVFRFLRTGIQLRLLLVISKLQNAKHSNANSLFASAGSLKLVALSRIFRRCCRACSVPEWFRNCKLQIFEFTQKLSLGNQLIHRRLSKRKSIGSGSDPETVRQAGRQSDGYGGWCLDRWFVPREALFKLIYAIKT